MKILADTHILLWMLTGSDLLSETGLNILLNEENEIYYSFINIWEIAIKHLLHKEDVPFSSEIFERYCKLAGLIRLDTIPEHAHLLKTLEYDKENAPKAHNDPFDKILLCQAKYEGMKFVTHDSLIPYYNEECILSV